MTSPKTRRKIAGHEPRATETMAAAVPQSNRSRRLAQPTATTAQFATKRRKPFVL